MHPEVLKKEQVEILSLLKLFNKDYYLVGGTAIALQIGHRYSIDFDLFAYKDVKRKSIKIFWQKIIIAYSIFYLKIPYNYIVLLIMLK